MSLVQERRSTWWIGVLIILLLLPALALTWMSVISVHDSEGILEQRYEQSLQAGTRQVVDTLQRNLQGVLSQTKAYTDMMQDLQSRDLSKPFSLKPPHSLLGVFIFQKSKLIYPFWPLQVDRVPNLTWTMDSSQYFNFSQDLRDEHLGKQLSERFHQDPNDFFNHLGILRVQTRLGQYKAVANGVNEWLPKLGRDSLSNEVRPSLWLLKFRSHLAMGNLKEARGTFQHSVKEFLERPGDFALDKVEFVFKEMLDANLSMNDLDAKTRDSLNNYKENLEYLLDQSQALQKFRPMLESQILPFLGGGGIHMIRVGEQICFILPQSSVDPSYFAVALFQANALDSSLLRGIAQNEDSRNLAFSVGPSENPYYSQGIKNNMEFFNSVELAAWHPFHTIQVYRSPASEIRTQAERRSALLYSILALSIATIFLSIYLAIRTIRNERSVYQLKTNILSSITHELKTPLTSIRMFAETLEGGRYRTQEQAQKYAAMITRESGRLQMLIDDILVYGRLENEAALDRKSILLTELMSEILQRVDPIAQAKKVSLTFKVESQALIMGDRALLESLFQNLIDNAVKYTPGGGHVELRIFSEDKMVAVAVKDTGVGIPSQALPHIFDPFYRVGDELTRRAKGSGIGLAIVRKSVDLHGAQIKVESREGQGSTFTVIFPQGA